MERVLMVKVRERAAGAGDVVAARAAAKAKGAAPAAAKAKDAPAAVKVAAPVKAAARARGANKGTRRLPKTKTSSPKRHASLC
jgi:hypothetical protein